MNITQQQIVDTLGVKPHIDPEVEVERRTTFLDDYLENSNAECYVLGISGGVDSTTAGRLAQLAVERRRARGKIGDFIAVRLPYHAQVDEADAQLALAFVKPDRVITINIGPTVDAMFSQLYPEYVPGQPLTAKQDFDKGNIKARARMIAQYGLAGKYNGLVIGTDHGAEAIMGFYTKHGDGACDLIPLSGLNKRQVRLCAAVMGAPDSLVNKVPTAGLEDNDPLKADEAAHGVKYTHIDDFLENKTVNPDAHASIVAQYEKTEHKRNMPPGPM